MFESFLLSLSCPFCKGRLKISKVLLKGGKKIIHAKVSCNCEVYPVLDGILFLKIDGAKEAALKILSENSTFLKKQRDLPIFLFRHPRTLTRYLFLVLTRIGLFRKLSFRFFVKLFIFLGVYKKDWGFYILNRANSDEFKAAKISTRLIRKGSRILDAGSGAGQTLLLLGKTTKEENLCGIDSSLPGLYLSKKYMAREANYLYLDLENPLPFRSDHFDDVILNDTLHYLKAKRSLGREVSRILKKSGLIILNNLHNKYRKKEFKDPVHFPETPAGYVSLFPNLRHSFYSEKEIKDGVLRYKKSSLAVRREKTFSLLLSQNPPRGDISLAPKNEAKYVKSLSS